MVRSLRLVVSAVALAAVLSACAGTASSMLPALRVATKFINAVRANDAARVCSVTTPAARRDLGRLLQQAGAPDAPNVCARPTIAPSRVRAAAMRPFLGVLGFITKDWKSG